MNVASPAESLSRLAPLFDDVGALKRIRRAGSPYSVAATLFLRAWKRVAHGGDVGAVARETTALAIVASRLGAIDAHVLARGGLDAAARADVMYGAFDRASGALEPGARAALRGALSCDVEYDDNGANVPSFALALAEQPRAGATAPDAPRLVLEPPESHADHCFGVCAYAMLAAPRYGATGEDAFLLGLTHHLHNAVMPDSGFAGEELLGDRLDALVERFTDDALAELPAKLASRIRDVRLRLLPAALDPEARAFHAGDVIDRVIQVRQYARVAAFETSQALDDLQLVHAGPIQRFHIEVLAETGLP